MTAFSQTTPPSSANNAACTESVGRLNVTSRVIFSLLLMLSPISNAEEIYRVINPDGSVSYTDKPASTDKDKASPVEIDKTKANVSESPDTIKSKEADWVKAARERREREQEEKAKQEQQADEEELTPRQAWKKEYKKAKQAVKDAEKALKEGSEARDGDFVGFINRTGGRAARPSEAYLERVESLKADLENAKKNLKKLKKQRPR